MNNSTGGASANAGATDTPGAAKMTRQSPFKLASLRKRARRLERIARRTLKNGSSTWGLHVAMMQEVDRIWREHDKGYFND